MCSNYQGGVVLLVSILDTFWSVVADESDKATARKGQDPGTEKFRGSGIFGAVGLTRILAEPLQADPRLPFTEHLGLILPPELPSRKDNVSAVWTQY
ncbi:uncharacterized protein FTOL_00336 [Fusarium torulosum]|uniref:Uncharacterized protein n=1 Tax=Fusarium torulosum TaxID=33205 RepID=A0AAE8LY72_9HYPO|nr:uncharacterized protein FTOL_00336 [Fusarium torulosum]